MVGWAVWALLQTAMWCEHTAVRPASALAAHRCYRASAPSSPPLPPLLRKRFTSSACCCTATAATTPPAASSEAGAGWRGVAMAGQRGEGQRGGGQREVAHGERSILLLPLPPPLPLLLPPHPPCLSDHSAQVVARPASTTRPSAPLAAQVRQGLGQVLRHRQISDVSFGAAGGQGGGGGTRGSHGHRCSPHRTGLNTCAATAAAAAALLAGLPLTLPPTTPAPRRFTRRLATAAKQRPPLVCLMAPAPRRRRRTTQRLSRVPRIEWTGLDCW
mgnify:CR=1 FL=1